MTQRGRAPEIKGMSGTGLRRLDARLFAAIDELLASGKAATVRKATLLLAAEGRIQGDGTDESKARRLARRYCDAKESQGIPRQQVRESASVGDMSTRTKPAPLSDATRLAKAEAQIASLTGIIARLQQAQQAMADRTTENELMLTELIENCARLVREHTSLNTKLAAFAGMRRRPRS